MTKIVYVYPNWADPYDTWLTDEVAAYLIENDWQVMISIHQEDIRDVVGDTAPTADWWEANHTPGAYALWNKLVDYDIPFSVDMSYLLAGYNAGCPVTSTWMASDYDAYYSVITDVLETTGALFVGYQREDGFSQSAIWLRSITSRLITQWWWPGAVYWDAGAEYIISGGDWPPETLAHRASLVDIFNYELYYIDSVPDAIQFAQFTKTNYPTIGWGFQTWYDVASQTSTWGCWSQNATLPIPPTSEADARRREVTYLYYIKSIVGALSNAQNIINVKGWTGAEVIDQCQFFDTAVKLDSPTHVDLTNIAYAT